MSRVAAAAVAVVLLAGCGPVTVTARVVTSGPQPTTTTLRVPADATPAEVVALALAARTQETP